MTAPVNPVDAHNGGPTPNASSVTAPGLTTLTDGDLLVGIFATAANATFSPPSGMVERGESAQSAGKNKVAVEFADQVLGAHGQTGPRTATTDKAAVGIGQLVALRPAGTTAPTTAPDAPTGLSTTPADGKVTLSWSAPASDGGSPILRYDVYRGTASGSEGTTPIGTSTETSFTDTSVTNGTRYYYTVKAVNAVGPGTSSAESSATPASAPAAPASLAATGGPGTVGLTWIAPSDGGSPITGYKVYRGTTSGGETLLTTIGAVTSWSDTVPAGTYYYTVSAINATGEGPKSSEAPATAGPPPAQTVPGAPQNLTGASASGKGVQLTWSAPASNGGSTILGYKVYRGTVSGVQTLLTQLGVVTTFKDASTTRGATYYYTVKAFNAIGDGPASNEVFARAK